MTDKPKTADEKIAAAVLVMAQKAISEDKIWNLTGPMKLQAKQHDGSYRVKPILPEVEFLLEGVYYGKTGKLIFQFSPMDNRDYQLVEVNETKVAETFQNIESHIVRAITGNDTEASLPVVLKFARDAVKEEIGKREAAEEKAKREEAEHDYGQVEGWGQF